MGLSDPVRLSTQNSSEVVASPPDRLVSEILRTTEKDISFSALQIVEQHPEILSSRSCVIDLVYEEYHRRRLRGQNVSISELARPFGNIESSICKLVEFDQVLDNHPSLLTGTPEINWPESGDVLCGLRLVEALGRGLFSRVFVARQELLGGRLIVAKVCLRGRQEASLLGKLNHRAICYPLSFSDVSEPSSPPRIGQDPDEQQDDSGTTPQAVAPYELSQNDVSVICMEYQTRATLHQLIEELHLEEVDRGTAGARIRQALASTNSPADGSLTSRSQRDAECPDSLEGIVTYWLEELADAICAAHALKILHCDIKPGNVLVLPDMSVQLMDFNLAWSQEQSETALAGGTMPYMSPEQLQMLVSADFRRSTVQSPELGTANSVDRSTDVWGLCATFWHLLTGNPPFGHTAEIPGRMNAAEEMLRRQQQGIGPEQIARAESLVPSDLCRLLLRGLSWNRQDRILDAAELLEEIRLCTRRMQDSAQSIQEVRPEKPQRRNWHRATLALAGVAVATLPLAAFWFVNSDRALSEEEVASVISDTNRLEALGDVRRAEDVLTAASARDPRCEPVAVRLAMSLLKRGNIGAAHNAIVTAADASSVPGIAKYVELFCRCQLLKIPRLSLQNADSERNNQDIEEQSSWVQAREEWKYFLSEPQFRDAAATNLAAMYFEAGEPGECRRVLNQYLLNKPNDSSERMRSALVIPEWKLQCDEEYCRRVAAEVEDLQKRSSIQLSRFEAACLINGLAILASIEQKQTGTVTESRLQQVRDAVDNCVPEFCEPEFLKPMLRLTAVVSSKELTQQIGQLISANRFRPVNRVDRLLIAPETLTQVFLSSR
ncbi:MAG: protein kinase domain-containing protein [Planctomyces sp.]